MVTMTFEVSLKQLRDFLRLPAPSLEDLTFQISATLLTLHIHPTSLPPSSIPSTDLKALARYLPAVQNLLLQDVLPHFVSILDDRSQELLRGLFVPQKKVEGLEIRRNIALVSYFTLPSYLNAPKQDHPTLSKPMRSFFISLLDTLSTEFGLDDLYHTIFPNKERITKEDKDGVRTLQWEDALRSIVSIPAKTGNAIGRWELEEADKVDVPVTLLPRPYFDRLGRHLESVLYEISQHPSPDVTPLRLVIEKLSSIGLLTSQSPNASSRTPSLLYSLLPSLLSHLHPPSSSPLPPYPPTFLPSVFLPLPSSILSTFINALTTHLSFYLIDPANPLEPHKPDGRIKRAVQVFQSIVGNAEVGSEAWQAVVQSVMAKKGKSRMGLGEWREQARNRLIVGWIAQGGDAAVKAFIEIIVDTWTDPKYVKFSMFSEQFSLTHVLLLSLSLLPTYSSWLIQLSHRSRFILAFQSYLSHPDPSIRRLGMVVGEIMSELTILETEDGQSEKKKQEGEIEELRKGLEVDEDNVDMKPKTTATGSGRVQLKFKGMWDGNGDGREESRWLRDNVGVKDANAITVGDDEQWLLGWKDVPSSPTVEPQPVSESSRGRRATRPANTEPSSPKPREKKPKIIMLDPDQQDDPLSGYASSSPSSSRAPSPTPEYLDEIAADPSLGLDEANKKKVKRPVYIPQLVALLKERDKPESVEMGLNWGEGLVRAKREFGTELAENAVGVTLMVLGLNDSFDIEGFEEKKQGLLNALIACAPKQVAPFLCEQYFNPQFSLQHKASILTALAIGARELAGLSVPQAPRTTRSIDFPSKTLPPTLHNKYISSADIPLNRLLGYDPDNQLDQAIDGIRNLILSKGARKGEETVSELAREKRLRVDEIRRPKIAPVNSHASSQMGRLARPPVVAFKDIAAEIFILPLINRFWQHFQDSSTREERAVMMGARYRAAGAGMVLSPMAMEKFMMALALMLDAARYSPLWLSVICPEALELAVTIGIRHPPRPLLSGEEGIDPSRAEAQVLSAALELTLVCLDISVDLDGGRTLAMDKAALVMAVGEWASGVFKVESEGGEVSAGQGGRIEGKIKAEAAGVVVKVGEIGEKWGHMGMDMGF
ncbi:telomere length regulation protein [Cryptococcus neoformans var. grubii Br795]|nr:telomere length regulation protein [Cryptococcus neoformans var. grubii Br795]